MTDTWLFLLNSLALPINFVCHSIIFIGGLYIAIHSRCIPIWLKTCLWYIGCSSFLINITIIIGWVLGSQCELSYSKIGLFGEVLFNILIAITTFVFFLTTISANIKYSKLRK